MSEYEIGKEMAALRQEMATMQKDLRAAEQQVNEVAGEVEVLIEALKGEGLISRPAGSDTWILHPAVAVLIHPKGDEED